MAINVYDPIIVADVIHVLATIQDDGTLVPMIALECEGKSLTAVYLDAKTLLGHIEQALNLLQDLRARQGG